MNDSTYHIKTGRTIAEGFKLGNGLKQEGLAPNLFNIALEYVIKKLSEEVKSTVFYSVTNRISRRHKHYGKNKRSSL